MTLVHHWRSMRRTNELREQRFAVALLAGAQSAVVLEQRPARALDFQIGLLLDAPGLVHGPRGVGDDVELVEGAAGARQVLANTFDEDWRLES
jgi:hypothetical protein